MFKTSGIILGALLAFLLIPVGASADTPANPGWGKARMADTAICVQKSTSLKGWRLRKAMASWNNVGIVTLTYSARCDKTKPFINVSAAPSVVYEGLERGGVAMPTWVYGPDNTRIITGADVILNNSFIANTDRLGKKCFGWYMTAHEIGHALGLDHSNDHNSVMSYDFPYFDYCHQMQWIDHTLLAELGY